MNRLALVAALAFVAAAPALAQLPLHVGGPLADLANGVYYDDQGNAYLVGAFRGTADFDPSAGSFTFTSLGLTDGFIAIYGPAGNFICAGPIRGPGQETVNDVKVRNGLIYVTGYYSAGADFGGLFPGNLGGLDGYVAAYSCASGTMLPTWVSTINGPGTQIGEDLDVHPLSPSNVWATGYFQNTTTFATGFTLASAGGTDVFVAGYDPFFGGLFDAFRVGGPQNDAGLGISLMRPELPCVTGYFRGVVDFDPSSAVFNLASAGNDDGFVACYLDPVPGNPMFFAPFNAFPISGPGVDRGYDVDTQLAGGQIVVNVTGGFSATANFNGPSFTSNGNLDAFVASYDTNANNLWVVPFGGPQLDVGFGIDGDECGNVVATGAFRAGPVNFDPFFSAGGFFLPTLNNYDAWVAGYDAFGTFRFANRVARNANDLGYGVAVKPSGAHLAAGEFGGTPIFSSGTNVAGSTYFPTYGGQDGYLAAYNINGAIQRGSCAVAPLGLELWSDFDAFSGGQFLDLAPFPSTPNNGTPIGGTVQGPGVVGVSALFPSPNDHIFIPADPSLAPGMNDLTVDAWVRWNNGAFLNHLSIVSNLDTPAAGNGYEVLLRRVSGTTWVIVVVLNDGAGAPATLTSPTFTFPANTWRFIAATVDHSVQANFYVDGVFIGSAAAPPEGSISWPGPMFLHRSILSSGSDRPGRLDEVEIFHTLLTPTDIAQLYAAGKCKPCWSAPFQPTSRTAQGDADGADATAPAVEATIEAPMMFTLGQSTPNPTTGLTEITFALPASAEVRLAVYDVLGREVAVLVAERREAGRHVARFDAGALPSGVYLYRLDAGGLTATRRLTVTR
jgi:hypothetical protein